MDKNRKEIKGRHKYADQTNRVGFGDNGILGGLVMKGWSCGDGEPSSLSPDRY